MKNLLLLAALVAATLFPSTTFAAEPPTPSDLVVVYNAGGPRFGHAPLGWEDFFQRAEQYEFILLHNIGGHYTKPMQFAQLSRARLVFGRESWTDYAKFAKFARKRTKWFGVYLGSPETFALLPGETDRQWLSRAIDELRPIIDARPDVIFFDAFQELDQPRYRLLVRRLIDVYKIQVGVEPCIFADQLEMYDWPVAVQREYLNNRAGSHGWNTGKNTERPLRNVDEHPTVLQLVRKTYLNTDVPAARKRGHVPAVNVGNLPLLKEAA